MRYIDNILHHPNLKNDEKRFQVHKLRVELCMFWISIKSIWENFDSSRHFFFYSLNEFSYSTIMTFPSFTGIRSFTRIVWPSAFVKIVSPPMPTVVVITEWDSDNEYPISFSAFGFPTPPRNTYSWRKFLNWSKLSDSRATATFPSKFRRIASFVGTMTVYWSNLTASVRCRLIEGAMATQRFFVKQILSTSEVGTVTTFSIPETPFSSWASIC